MSKKHIIVDIDGTIAKRNGREPYDMRTVITEPVPTIIDLVLALVGMNHGIIFVTGQHNQFIQTGKNIATRWIIKST